jgi:hypothetical protein
MKRNNITAQHCGGATLDDRTHLQIFRIADG